MTDENLQKLHGDGPLMTNAAVNRNHAARMFKAGMTPEEIARAFPEVFTFTRGEGGGLGQKYDSVYVSSGRKETRRMIVKSAVDEAIALHKSMKKGRRDFEKAVKTAARVKREEAKQLKAHIARAKKEIAESARRGEQPHLRTKEDIARTAHSFGQAAYFEEKRVRGMTAKHESGGNPKTRKPSFKRGDFVRVKGLGTWVGKITFGPQLDTELGLKKWKVTRDFDGLQKWWNDTSLEKLSKKGSRHEAGKNPLTKREFDALTKERGGTGKGGDSGMARDEIAAYRHLRKRPGRGSYARLDERDLLAERASERRRRPDAPLRGLQSAPKAVGGSAFLRSWGEAITKPLRGDPHQLASMSREELKAYRGGAGKKDAALRARIDKLLGKK